MICKIITTDHNGDIVSIAEIDAVPICQKDFCLDCGDCLACAGKECFYFPKRKSGHKFVREVKLVSGLDSSVINLLTEHQMDDKRQPGHPSDFIMHHLEQADDGIVVIGAGGGGGTTGGGGAGGPASVIDQPLLQQPVLDETDSGLLRHAKAELKLAGLYGKESDYSGMIGEAVEELIKTFAAQGHSGFSAQMTIDIFTRVASYDVLTPLTNDPDEWMDVANGMWQSRRNPNIFSKDGGQTAYHVDRPHDDVAIAPKAD